MSFIQTIIIFVGYIRNFITIVIALVGSLILQIIGRAGYTGIFLLMLLESAAIPIPSEITMPFSGFLAGRGILNFWLAVMAGTLGNSAGSLVLYWIGKYGGGAFLSRWGYLLFIKEAHLTKAEQWFQKYGVQAVFFGRLLPVIRTYISFPAGVANMNLWKFNFYTLAGSFIWTMTLAYVGLILGERWNILEAYFRKLDILIIAAVIAALVWISIKYLRRKNSDS
ncbi:MAG: DedA family protein [bacterium]|nr:DedA family protein [bacterium]